MTEQQINWLKSLEPFENENLIPDIPSANTDEEFKLIVDTLIRCGAIPKKDLKVGVTYLGSCRNSSKATWNGECFDYERYKFGTYYMDTIPHFEDEKYHDIFIPIKEV